jgi:hypothetical protein
MVGLTFSVGLQILLSKTIRIGDINIIFRVAILIFSNLGPPTNLLL